MSKNKSLSFIEFLSQINGGGAAASEKQAALDQVKKELQEEKAKKIRVDLIAFHRRMEDRVNALRVLRSQEAAVRKQIQDLKDEIEKYLSQQDESFKI